MARTPDRFARWLFHHGRAHLYVRDAHVATIRGKRKVWWVYRVGKPKFGPFPSLKVAQSWAVDAADDG